MEAAGEYEKHPDRVTDVSLIKYPWSNFMIINWLPIL